MMPPCIGQDLALQYLQAGLACQRLAPAYLFAGPAGIGRALTARWFAQALLCPERSRSRGDRPCGQCSTCQRVQQGSHPDLLWVEPTYKHQNRLLTPSEAIAAGLKRKSPPQTRLEQIRAISRFAIRTPLEAVRSAIILTNAETLAEAAANALLKTLEEPRQARLILLATDPAALLSTIVSRCQLIPFRRLSTSQTADILARNGHTDIPAAILSLAQGSPGRAIQALEYWQAIPAELLEPLQQWPATQRQSLQLGRAIAKQLDVPAQLWLVEYLQQHFWQQSRGAIVQRLEQLRKHLLAFVQPQLAWEVALSPAIPTQSAISR
ncbi:DNA polymerase III subunit delta' [Synechococcus sp. PCC 7336]|uniref:DNA polymerase III subunit delta' n=1 Tax=Synechococcus sp. PCC 7336 TaxID=195250 RepID=UPI000345464E|nr:DNA polymerase III subunit delta' [Synechococcus sp. PCC 7336]